MTLLELLILVMHVHYDAQIRKGHSREVWYAAHKLASVDMDLHEGG